MDRTKKTTLSERIASVLNVTPASFDPESEINENTTPNNLEDDGDKEFEESDNEIVESSNFRKRNVQLLEEEDNRYAGKKSTRQSLNQFDSDETDEEEESDQESSGTEDPSNEEDDDNESDENVDDESDADTDVQDDLDSGSDEKHTKNKVSAQFKHLNETDGSVQIKKGICVRNQMNIWENLLEIRIQLQKCLLASNKMPQEEYFKEIQSNSGNEFKNKVKDTKKSIINTLDKLLLLQNLLQKQFPETKKLDSKRKGKQSDEEIPSDTEDENNDDEDDEVPKKKMKFGELKNEIQRRHAQYKNYRNNVIEKWNSKTRLAVSKSNSTNNYTVLNQIEHNLSDRSKLLKRTQLKKSNYNILGVNNNEDVVDEEHNTNIFDDDDFYHQLLRELIEVKSADITDPVQLSRKWIQVHSMRNKHKRNIDTRATKGRKIRYTVHTKLVNYSPPLDSTSMYGDTIKNDLFGSLFE